MGDALKYFNRENYRRALELFLDELENSTNREEIAYNANLAGLCLYFLHYPRESLKYFQVALDNTEGIENQKVQENVDEVKRFIERVQNDIEELESKLEVEEDKKQRGIILSNLGLLHYFLGMREEAEKNFGEAERIFRNLRDNVALGAVYSNFALLYDDMRQLDYLYRALDLFEKEGHIKAQVETLYHLAMYYLEDDYVDEALHFIKKALSMLEKGGDYELKKKIYEVAADIYMEKGDVEKALKFTESASNL